MSLLVARSTHAPWTRLVVPACAWLGAWAVWAGFSSPSRPLGGSAAMAFVTVWPLLAVALPRRAPWIGLAALGACALGMPGAVAASWSSFPVAFVSLTMLGAVSLGPLLPLAWGWTRTPVTRCVAYECALLAAYGVFAATVNREGVTATDRALGPVVAGATVLAACAGLAWDLAARAQMRRVLAGRVAGWKVDAPETQRLPWLTWLGDVEGDARRTLVRVVEVGVAYRSGPAQEIAVARVPRAVSRVGTSSVACGLLLLAALWRVVSW
jgi:hypothetical protein